MAKRLGIEVSIAVADAVVAADVDVIAAYPITPQTHIVESISEKIAEGELDGEYICVESEHSALSACLGSSAAGARTFTSTAGQGLELMHEVVYVAASMRLPTTTWRWAFTRPEPPTVLLVMVIESSGATITASTP